MEILALLKSVVITIGIPLLVRYAGHYVSNANRRFKVDFAGTIVSGVIELVKIQKGISAPTAALFQEMVAAAKAALIAQGFDPAKAGGIAEREVANQMGYAFEKAKVLESAVLPA